MGRKRGWRFVVYTSGFLLLYFAFILSFPDHATAGSPTVIYGINSDNNSVESSEGDVQITIKFPNLKLTRRRQLKGENISETSKNSKSFAPSIGSLFRNVNSSSRLNNGENEKGNATASRIISESSEETINARKLGSHGNLITRKKRQIRLQNPKQGRSVAPKFRRASGSPKERQRRKATSGNGVNHEIMKRSITDPDSSAEQETGPAPGVFNAEGGSSEEYEEEYEQDEEQGRTKVNIFLETLSNRPGANVSVSLEKSGKDRNTGGAQIRIDLDNSEFMNLNISLDKGNGEQQLGGIPTGFKIISSNNERAAVRSKFRGRAAVPLAKPLADTKKNTVPVAPEKIVKVVPAINETKAVPATKKPNTNLTKPTLVAAKQLPATQPKKESPKSTSNVKANSKQSKDFALQQIIMKQQSEAEAFLEGIEKKYSLLCHENTLLSYNEQIGRKSEKDDGESPKANEYFAEFQEEIQAEIGTRFEHWKNFTSPLLRKEFKTLMQDGQGLMADEDSQRMQELEKSMDTTYKETFVCGYKSPKDANCTMQLEPEIQEIFQDARDYDELKYYWTAWHDAVGTRIDSADYEEFIILQNKFAKGNNYPNSAAVWSEEYNEGTEDWTEVKFRKNIVDLWEQLKPYYKILHAYVRMKLSKYPNYAGKIKRCGPIPVHLLGNMFGQSWTTVDNITKPYPDVVPLDATAEMRKQKYTPKKMLEVADSFYQSMGLKKLPASFWELSVYTKSNKNNEMTCHPAAHDLCLGRFGEDYRITMCSVVSQRDLVTMHHELGHIQYMMQYSHLRYGFRGASNPGFDESVGDVLAMAVTTPEHLQCYLGLNLGLAIKCNDTTQKQYPVTKTDINYLFLSALESIAFFPFAVTMESWRWLIMEDKLTAKDFNNKWWEMRKEIQGVIPPVPRPANVFDPGAKYHIINHASYLRYFMSTIFQFDFYESLCKAAGQYNPKDPNGKPLYKCDFTGSKKAGTLLKNMLKQGGSVAWPKALKEITGREYATVEPLLKYFKPLFDKLTELLKAGKEDDCLTKPWT